MSSVINIVPFIQPILPFTQPVCGEVYLPGSKSITNRALLLAALNSGVTVLQNALFSEDTMIMVEALQKLGFFIQINPSERSISVRGEGGKIPSSTATIDVGNAGTVARFLVALLSLRKGGEYRLDGSECMRKRPINPLLTALESVGAIEVHYHGEFGYFPFTLKTKGLKPGIVKIDASESGQFLSALLMVAPLIPGGFIVDVSGQIVSKPFITMTLAMINEFGAMLPKIEQMGYRYIFNNPNGYHFTKKTYLIEPDATAASYFLALPLVVGGQITLYGLSMDPMKQGDIDFSYIVEKIGLTIRKTQKFWFVERAKKPLMQVAETDFNDISDTFLTLAAIAPLLKTPTYVKGIAHTRLQETDRPFAVAAELKRLGQVIEQTNDSILIRPHPLHPGVVETYGDHRMAMSFGILGCFDLFENGKSWLSIYNPYCCSKTFPNFFDVLDKLRVESIK